MPGLTNMGIGAAWAIGGGLLTVITIGVSGGGFVVLFWGAILVGIIQFLIGLTQWIVYSTSSQKTKDLHHLKIDVRVVMRSMIAVAAADSVLEENEIGMIQLISRSLFGKEIDDYTIRDEFEKMKGQDFIEELEPIAAQTSYDGALLAVKATLMVSLADGHEAEAENLLVRRIANRLNVSQEDYETCVQDAIAMLNRLFAEEDEVAENTHAKDPSMAR